MISVVAGVLEQKGKILITQRRPEDILPLKWEFPGGKVEEDESEQDALVRELIEELGITVAVGSYIGESSVHHKGKDYAIKYYECSILEGEPQLLEVHDMVWITPDELENYDMTKSDEEIIARIHDARR
ncbi:MAG: (deoxy)nucleoside triphosphate pyrophosphohydrolase [Candidatus Woesearchaeota archaeon]|nr:(deoxy)nucleoside triphosphate pyrophosphohydrolase [Candidatus Woesearchaeota archaeon]